MEQMGGGRPGQVLPSYSAVFEISRASVCSKGMWGSFVAKHT